MAWRRWKRGIVVAIAVSLALITAPAASAQPSQSEQAALLGREGLELFERLQWRDAFEKFQQADGIVHSPVLRLYMARCRRNDGKLLHARDLFDHVIAEPLSEDSPPQWAQARVDAKREREVMAQRIPSVVVGVRGPGADGAAIILDGAPAQMAVAIELDPGNHLLLAVAKDGRRAQASFELVEGERERHVAVALEAPAAMALAPAAPAVAPRKGSADSRSAARDRGWLITGGVLVGLGGASLVVGTVTGGVALAKGKAFLAGCEQQGTDTVCNPEAQSEEQRIRTLARAATGTLIAGGILATAGTLTLVLSPRRMPRGAAAWLDAGPSSLSLRVSF
jgi:hypothetical protein